MPSHYERCLLTQPPGGEGQVEILRTSDPPEESDACVLVSWHSAAQSQIGIKKIIKKTYNLAPTRDEGREGQLLSTDFERCMNRGCSFEVGVERVCLDSLFSGLKRRKVSPDSGSAAN